MLHEYHNKIQEYEESVRAIMQKRQEILETTRAEGEALEGQLES